MKKTILAMFVVVLASVYGYSAGNFALDLPGKAWVLEIGMEGFELERYEMAPDLSAVNLQRIIKQPEWLCPLFWKRRKVWAGAKNAGIFTGRRHKKVR